MEELIEKLTDEGYLKSKRIISAFEKIDRADFVTKDMKSQSNLNIALPTTHGQTISQPLTVAFMLELLQAKTGDVILDIGSGTGWQTALLAELVGESGKIYAIERVPDLKRFGEKNLEKYNYNNVEFICGDGTRGYDKAAPYNRIIVAAAAEIGIPDVLLKQLRVGGRLVIPVGKYDQEMVMVEKVAKNDYKEKRHPGFQFVPLIPKKWGE